MGYRLLFVWLFCLLCVPARTQNIHSTEDIIVDILSVLTEADEGETDFSSYYDDLFALAQNPLNLNTATREQLEDLIFLSDIQIENILYYIYQYGDIHSVYELRLIEGLDENDVRRLLPFVRIESGGRTPEKLYWREIWKYGKNDAYLRFGGNLEEAKGYQSTEDENRKYAGSPLHHLLKYQFHYKDRILFGVLAEKDAGERFLPNSGKGYDFLSAYAQVNHIGLFKTIVLGDFRANFGEGLVLKTNFSMGKSSQALNLNRPKTGLRKSSSTDEYNFFRGIGTTVQAGGFNITAFYSNKNIDGDTTVGSFSGISKTGLHRTENEIQKRHAAGQQILGGNVTFTRSQLQAGLTAVHTIFSHSLEPAPNLYNATYFRGKHQTTAGLHYRFRLGKLNVFGETALTSGFAAATVNGLNFMPVSKVGLVVLHRYISPHYDSFYANVFGESPSQSMNEHGLYVGTEIHPFRKWKFSAYADAYRFPWLKYGLSSPSSGSDYLMNAEFTPQQNLWMYWRINYESKQVNFPQTFNPAEELIPHKKLAFRFGLNRVYGNFRFQTILYGNIVHKDGFAQTYGVSALQDLSYSFKKIPLHIDFRYQFFDAKDYENRISSYEKDVLHTFSIPMNYGIGSRCYLNLKYNPSKNFSLWLKIAQTIYADNRETTGTGNDETKGNRRTTVRALLRWTF